MLPDHFKAIVSERDALHRSFLTVQAASASLKHDLEKRDMENGVLGERLAMMEKQLTAAADDRLQLRAENEELKKKLVHAKDHYKEHDARRQHFLETKHAEMKAIKKELKKANEIQRETQGLLLKQLEEHRQLQQENQALRERAESEGKQAHALRDTIRALYEAQQSQQAQLEEQFVELERERDAGAALKKLLADTSANLDFTTRMKDLAESDARAALIDSRSAIAALDAAQIEGKQLQERVTGLEGRVQREEARERDAERARVLVRELVEEIVDLTEVMRGAAGDQEEELKELERGREQERAAGQQEKEKLQRSVDALRAEQSAGEERAAELQRMLCEAEVSEKRPASPVKEPYILPTVTYSRICCAQVRAAAAQAARHEREAGLRRAAGVASLVASKRAPLKSPTK